MLGVILRITITSEGYGGTSFEVIFAIGYGEYEVIERYF